LGINPLLLLKIKHTLQMSGIGFSFKSSSLFSALLAQHLQPSTPLQGTRELVAQVEFASSGCALLHLCIHLGLQVHRVGPILFCLKEKHQQGLMVVGALCHDILGGEFLAVGEL
jgi:hypothetical protein